MDQKTKELLAELVEKSGLPLSLDLVEAGDEAEEAVRVKLRAMLKKLDGTRSKREFLREYITGRLPEASAKEKLASFYLDAAEPWEMFLVSLREEDVQEKKMVRSVLTSIFSTPNDYVLETSQRNIAVIRQIRTKCRAEELRERAEKIAGTMEADAMLNVRVSYDRCTDDALGLPKSYQNCVAALEINEIFRHPENVIGYHDLGLSKLVRALPREICREYMQDRLSGADFGMLDNETVGTIRCFFENGLSIAETARSLYIHRNTLVYRLDKFERMMGLDIRKFEDAVTCRIGMLMYEYLK